MVEQAADAQDKEIAAMAVISSALSSLADGEARQRVISYVLARYSPSLSSSIPVPATRVGTSSSGYSGSAAKASSNGIGEIPGIAMLTEAGDLRITVRDLKARSGLDAAVRLAYVAIYAYQKLVGQPLPSPSVLTPLLKTWRLYDGNTRARLAKDKGIFRSGDDLSLDAHATRDAERFIQEILDDGVEGSWRPK
jgi:hypothetical protein